MNDYWHRRWTCPFYQRSGKLYVRCEGGREVKWRNVEEAKRDMARYCASLRGWEECPVARELLEKYEG